jgi:hypothetical protein
MPIRQSYSRFSIEVADSWTADARVQDICGEQVPHLAIMPRHNDAELRFTPDERGIITADVWIDYVGRINAGAMTITARFKARTAQKLPLEPNQGDVTLVLLI